MSKKMHVFLVGICAGMMVLTGTLMAQDDVMAPDAGVADVASDISADIRSQPVRLSEQGLPGLDTLVELRSLDPWDIVQLIEFLAYKGGLNNIVIGAGVSGTTTKLKFENVTVGDALEVVLAVNKLAYVVSNNIITIMTDEEYRLQYGVSFYDNKQVHVVDLKYADPARVANMLQPIKSTIGTVVSDPQTGTMILVDTPQKIEEMMVIIEKTDLATISRIVPTETKTFKLQYADVELIQEELLTLITPEIGSVRADLRTKTLIVTDLPHKLPEIVQLIEAFDAKEKQVFIEAKIITVQLTDDFKLGINWDYVIQGLDPRYKLGAAIAHTAADPESILPSVGQLSYQALTGGGGSLNMVLEALDNMGDTKVLSNPHVAVISGEEATVKVVTDQPYAEASLESGTTNVVGESIIFIEVGVSLSVTPVINDNGMIRMTIKPEISTVVGTYQAYRNVPIVRKSYSETTVVIKDNETILIAGMIENATREATSSVPILGRIPLLGWLFRAKGTAAETLETIVFLTPRIITGEEPITLLRDKKKQPKPLRRVGSSSGKAMKPVR